LLDTAIIIMRIWLFPKALWLFLFVSHSSRIQYSKCENSKAIYRQSSSTTTEQKQAEQQSTTICSSRSELELRQASGHFCSTNNDCTEPYNVCRQRKCRCGIGMMKTCNQCLPRKLRCPFGEPLMRGNNYRMCKIDTNTLLSDCPKRAVCVALDRIFRTNTTRNIYINGICCLNAVGKPRHQCPTGKALQHLQPASVCNSTTCPLSTHFCHLKATVISAFTACCPRPCMNDTYYTSTLCASRPTDAVDL
ncbi:hypothetical protein T4B_6905, partial [Trichinella pseudospiralis]